MRHVGVPNLVPSEQARLKALAKKSKKQQPLTEEEREEMGHLKAIMRPDVPYDELHPSYDLLGKAD